MDVRLYGSQFGFADTVTVSAPHEASLGDNTLVTALGSILLLSTGDYSNSNASIKSGAEVAAHSVAIIASRDAKIGDGASVVTTGNLSVISTGSYSGSHARLQSGAIVTVGEDLNLASGNFATIGQNVGLSVAGNLNMDAGAPNKCTVSGSADVVYATKSGVCASAL